MTVLHRDLSGCKVVVTGGAGFIGSRTVDLLARAGCREIAVIDDMIRGRPDNLHAALENSSIHLIQGDIGKRGLMCDVLRDADTVFHLAALRITQCAVEPARAMEVMVNATFDLLELCVQYRVQKVIMASSASIYGMATEFPTPENHHSYGNRTFYGAAKAFGEALLRSFYDISGLDYVALRYFNVYGPRMDIHGRYTEVMIRWMERLERGLPPIIFGNGAQTMDLVNVTDVARANFLAATAPASDVALNVGSGTETSLLELARLLGEAMDRGNIQPIHEAERAINPVPRRQAATDAARQIIGFTALTPLKEGIQNLVEWWRGQTSNTGRAGGKAA
jgi:nucleoside-diphosphate-sugar epimerase